VIVYQGIVVMAIADSPESIVTISDEARRRAVDARSGQAGAETYALWIEVTGTAGAEYTYDLYLHPLQHAGPGDVVQRHDDLSLVVPEDSVAKLAGAQIGYATGPMGEGWVVDNPNKAGPILSIGKAPSMGNPGLGGPPMESPAVGAGPPPGDLTGDVVTRVHQVLEQHINPMIASHGGRAELVSVDGATAYLRLGGGCQGCGMATVTLTQGIEVAIKEAVPEITEIVDVTDHAAGTNPYFEASKK
jgi:Fe/S biogenesis protein NfuA